MNQEIYVNITKDSSIHKGSTLHEKNQLRNWPRLWYNEGMGHYLSDVQDDITECPFCGKLTERSGLYSAICLCDGWQLSHHTWSGLYKFRDIFTDEERRALDDYSDKTEDLRDSANDKIIKKLSSLGYNTKTLVDSQKYKVQSRKRDAKRRVKRAEEDLAAAKLYKAKVSKG